MARKFSGEVSSITTFNGQQMDKQVLEGEEVETLNGEDEQVLTPYEYEQFHVDPSTKFTVQDNPPGRIRK